MIKLDDQSVSWSSDSLGSKVRDLASRERLPIFTFALLSIEIRKNLGLSADAWFCSNMFSKIASVSGVFFKDFVFCVFSDDILSDLAPHQSFPVTVTGSSGNSIVL